MSDAHYVAYRLLALLSVAIVPCLQPATTNGDAKLAAISTAISVGIVGLFSKYC